MPKTRIHKELVQNFTELFSDQRQVIYAINGIVPQGEIRWSESIAKTWDNISFNAIGNAGAAYLAQSLSLFSLSVSGNHMGGWVHCSFREVRLSRDCRLVTVRLEIGGRTPHHPPCAA